MGRARRDAGARHPEGAAGELLPVAARGNVDGASGRGGGGAGGVGPRVSNRKVDELERAPGLEGISKLEVSRVCATLDAEVEAFRTRPISGEHPYLWIDATYHKVHQDGRGIADGGRRRDG